MIAISNKYAGKRVRIRGIVPMPDGDLMLGQGDHVGYITFIDGKKFWFNSDSPKHDKSLCSFLSVGMWIIVDILSNNEA
jgi:hypothetical protein